MVGAHWGRLTFNDHTPVYLVSEWPRISAEGSYRQLGYLW